MGSPSPHTGQGVGQSLFPAELKGAGCVASSSALLAPELYLHGPSLVRLRRSTGGSPYAVCTTVATKAVWRRQAHLIRECTCSTLVCLSTPCAKAAERGPHLCTRTASSLAETSHTLTSGFPHWQTLCVVGVVTKAFWCSILVWSLR